MNKSLTKIDFLLIGTAFVLCLAVFFASHAATLTPSPYYQEQLAAAELMQQCMDAVKDYKVQRGIPLSELDLHNTGLLGEEFNGLTTTLGDLEAKRTTASSDMAALMVVLLREAGVQPGDRIGASFSGSFPAMNLATLSACAAMNVDVVVIASAGSSTYGGNTPGLSFPEMMVLLMEDDLLPQSSYRITLGGGADTGGGMDPDMVADIEARLSNLGVSIWYEPDYQTNLQQRIAFFEADGDIACYVGVGGNLISSGRGDTLFPYGVVQPDRRASINEKSGLMEVFHAKGIPVIHILNIKKLVADYNLPLDPASLPEPGSSGIYYQITYPRLPLVLALLLAAAVLALTRIRGKRHA